MVPLSERATDIRQWALLWLRKEGLAFEANLPVLEPTLCLRPANDIVGRMLAMHAVAACTYGFDKALALDWINAEGIVHALTNREAEFLSGIGESRLVFRDQIEGLWILAWLLGLHDRLRFLEGCPDDAVRLMPDLKQTQNSTALRDRVAIRPEVDVLRALDLYYLCHWRMVQSRLDGHRLVAHRLVAVEETIVVERRRALEWALCASPWDNVELDT